MSGTVFYGVFLDTPRSIVPGGRGTTGRARLDDFDTIHVVRRVCTPGGGVHYGCRERVIFCVRMIFFRFFLPYKDRDPEGVWPEPRNL